MPSRLRQARVHAEKPAQPWSRGCGCSRRCRIEADVIDLNPRAISKPWTTATSAATLTPPRPTDAENTPSVMDAPQKMADSADPPPAPNPPVYRTARAPRQPLVGADRVETTRAWLGAGAPRQRWTKLLLPQRLQEAVFSFRTEFGRPAASMRLSIATPMQASVSRPASLRARRRVPMMDL
jgi:hypothetical protein